MCLVDTGEEAATSTAAATSEPSAPGHGAGRHPYRTVLRIGLALVVAVIAVAAATGTTDDLPRGAIIGVLVVMAFAGLAGRGRRIPPEDDA